MNKKKNKISKINFLKNLKENRDENPEEDIMPQ